MIKQARFALSALKQFDPRKLTAATYILGGFREKNMVLEFNFIAFISVGKMVILFQKELLKGKRHVKIF